MIFATGNKGKAREFQEILGNTVGEIRTMKEAGIDIDIVEDGKSFEENALIKARAIAKAINYSEPVISDDSGLEVDFLNGEPGIYSARWMGEDTSYDIKNAELIKLVEPADKDKRTCRYVAAVAVVLEDGTELCVRGTMEGEIAYQPAGENGFGYDPVFYVPKYEKTVAELSPDEKNAISHRGNALRLMKEKLENR